MILYSVEDNENYEFDWDTVKAAIYDEGWPPNGLHIANDGSADITLTINGLTLTIKPAETLTDRFKPFEAFTLAATDSYRLLITRG